MILNLANRNLKVKIIKNLLHYDLYIINKINS